MGIANIQDFMVYFFELDIFSLSKTRGQMYGEILPDRQVAVQADRGYFIKRIPAFASNRNHAHLTANVGKNKTKQTKKPQKTSSIFSRLILSRQCVVLLF